LMLKHSWSNIIVCLITIAWECVLYYSAILAHYDRAVG
jgi:hypothetical protein